MPAAWRTIETSSTKVEPEPAEEITVARDDSDPIRAGLARDEGYRDADRAGARATKVRRRLLNQNRLERV